MKKNKIFAYLKYAETKKAETQKIIEAKRNHTYVVPETVYPPKAETARLPKSCNSLADIKVCLQGEQNENPKVRLNIKRTV